MRLLNVFVLGLDEQNLQTLRHVPRLSGYRFYQLLTVEELQQGEIPVEQLLDSAERQLDAFEATDGPVDAIVGYWDFPVSTMLPVLCGRRGLPHATLESVLKCEHKYWSRLVQQQVIDEHPKFALAQLDAEGPPADLDYPMWLKPVKSVSSALAFKVNDDAEFHDAIEEIGAGIDRLGEPFEYLLSMVELPPEVADAGGKACLAEEAMSGLQAATEGYSHRGDVRVYGVLDSVNYPDSYSFLRHQYPSQLPAELTDKMVDISERVIAHIGLDMAAFSVEFFCQPDTGEVRLLEINPRHSQSHAELFDYVDGAPNHHAMLRLALGEEPEMPRGEGPDDIAAKWLHRTFVDDAVVTRVPTAEEIAEIESDIPGISIHIVVDEGVRLSELEEQDTASYELAQVYIGAADVDEMRRKFDTVIERLPIELED